jgi:4-hydroxy-tetrahydrodipicolinate synthase
MSPFQPSLIAPGLIAPSPFAPGLVHTPVTPFTREGAIDFDRYAKLIEFHIGNGADTLALPMHAGESVSLPDGERRALLEFAIKCVDGRTPIIAHVSETGTGIAVALARHAESTGASAIVATTPYYWTPPPTMVLEHFFQIGAAVKIPFFLYNAPEDMQGAKVDAELCRKLIAKLSNFAGVVDLSLDWQFMIELMTDAPRLRPDFQLLAGTELLVSAGAIGATGMFAPLAGIAPKLVRELYELCRDQKLFEARSVQERLAALRQAVKPGGVASLKSAMGAMGRDCGEPRPPLLALDAIAYQKLVGALDAIAALRAEPQGW